MDSLELKLKQLCNAGQSNEYYTEPSVPITLCPYNSSEAAEPVEKNLTPVYYDKIYGIFLDKSLVHERKIDLDKSQIFVNDKEIKFEKKEIDSNVIIQPIIEDKKDERKNNSARMFLDCPGYVEIFFVFSLSDGSEPLKYRTKEYLVALLRRGDKKNKELSAMVNYVWSHRDRFLLYGQSQSKIKGELKENGKKSLSAQLRLLEKIAVAYESSYGYFRANSRYCIKPTTRIEDFERLQYVSPVTLQYIVSHPEQLRTVSQGGGIRIGNKSYQPQKTLMLQNVKSFDTYENRVILGFLRRLIDETDELYKKLPVTVKNSASDKYSDEYISLPDYLVMVSINEADRTKERIKFLNDKFRELWGLYSAIFSFSVEPLLYNPRPTAILLTVPGYNKLFKLIQQWLRYGVYDFGGEEFLLSLMKVSQLYEVFILVKLLCFFESKGYVVKEDSKPFEYKPKQIAKQIEDESKLIQDKRSTLWRYRNTKCQNTFIFSKEKHHSVTLYFQPVIYDKDYNLERNKIGLYRDNSRYDWADSSDSKKGYYYTPDYLIKFERDGCSRYLILDAKFSTRENLIEYQIKDLVFKYLFMINGRDKIDSIAGVCIIYGKNRDTQVNNDMICDLYGDKKNEYSQFLKLIPLFADEEGGHDKENDYFEREIEKMLIGNEKHSWYSW